MNAVVAAATEEPPVLALRPGVLENAAVALAMQILFIISIAAAATAAALLLVRRPRTNELLARPWSDVDLLRITAILLALAALAGLLMSWADSRWSDRWSPGEWRAMTMAAQSFVFHWPILSFATSRMRRLHVRSREAFGMRPRALPREMLMALGLYLAAMPLAAAAAWGSRSVLRWAGREPLVQPVLEAALDPGAGTARTYLLFLAVVVAPVAEEILFRGIALPVLARRLGPWAALGATSLVFAAVHLDLTAAPPLFVLGLAFGLAYLYTGSLAVPITMHAAVNGVSLAVAGWLMR